MITTRKPDETKSQIDFFWKENDHLLGYAIMLEDGYYSFSFDGDGMWPSYALMAIAHKLDELNKPWDDHINEYFKNNPVNENEQNNSECDFGLLHDSTDSSVHNPEADSPN